VRRRGPAPPVRLSPVRAASPPLAEPIAAEPTRPGRGRRARRPFRDAPGAGFGLGVVVVLVAMALVGPGLVARSPTEQDHEAILALPGPRHLLGTDELGRDLLTRLVHGVRPSLAAGVISVGMAVVLGVPMGLVAGHFGGWLDEGLMRAADTLWSFPGLVLAIAVAAILGPGLANAMVAIGIVYAPVFARLVRAQTLAVRELEYVESARSLGASDARIVARYVWPNVSPPVLVQSSLMLGQAILFEAALSFLGLGVQPPAPAWGSMLRTAYQYIEVDPWYSLLPGGAIFLTVLAFNLLGDGIRQALDPRLRTLGRDGAGLGSGREP
jgi:peptide/nickel transport system permease protein